MRDVLAHRMEDGTETFSMLATMTYKTEEHAISSILIHEITTQAGNAADANALGNLICGILSEQWNRCLKEEVVSSNACCTNVVRSLGIYPRNIKLSSSAMLLDVQALPYLYAFAYTSSSNDGGITCLKANI